MIIGIIGYFTIPTVAGWIIMAGGMGNYGKNVTSSAGKAGSVAAGMAGATARKYCRTIIKKVKAPPNLPPAGRGIRRKP